MDDFSLKIHRTQILSFLKKVEKIADLSAAEAFEGTTIAIVQQDDIFNISDNFGTDFFISMHPKFGSIIVAKGMYNGLALNINLKSFT